MSIDSTFLIIVIFSLISGIGGVIIASVLLLLSDKSRKSLTYNLLSFASGTLLSLSFMELLPEALEEAPVKSVMLTVLLGIIFFIITGKVLSNYHLHSHEGEETGHHIDPKVSSIIIIGGILHNFIDGILITVSFLQSFEMGLLVSISIITHEIPHEVSDFVVLLESGFSRKKALIYNLLTGLGTVIGSVLAYMFLIQLRVMLPYIMALAAASFIYITISELIPKLHQEKSISKSLFQFLLILVGIFTIVFVNILSGHKH